MSLQSINILILEKKQNTSQFINTHLETCNISAKIESIQDISLIQNAIENKNNLVLLCDTSVKEYVDNFNNILEAIGIFPVILIIDNHNHKQAIALIQAGAQEYIFLDTFKWNHFIHMADISIERQKQVFLIKQKFDDFHFNEERCALALQGAKDGVWDWNLLTNEIYYSLHWKNIIGCITEDFSTKPDEWFNRIHPDDILNFKAQIKAHLERKTYSLECEHRILHENTKFRWVVAKGSAVFNREGKPVRLIGSLRDISDRKETEEGLKNALDELRYALASEKVLLDELDKRNKDLTELSITDGLTGLYNHRFIQERFSFEFKRARRYPTPLSCMMIDIDHFKKINDTYGHQFGDLVLRELSAIIKHNTRDVDICGRYGGEEFVIITTQSAEGAMKHAAKLHKSIEECEFKNDEYSIHITVSIGISEYMDDITSKQEMIERSDIAMYHAKEDGRNLIRVWKKTEKKDEHILDETSISELKTKVTSLSDQMRATYMESTYALLKAVDAKDHYTQEHSENVSKYSVAIAKKMKIPEENVEIIKNAALLHDIGKIGIDKSILLKKSSLTSGEFEILKKHPVIGVAILKNVQFLEKEIPIIQHHHEWYNGCGYPQGLKEREIPMGALILGVADAFDAMTTSHEYKEKLSQEEAINELKRGKETQFSSKVVDVFLNIIEEKRHYSNI